MSFPGLPMRVERQLKPVPLLKCSRQIAGIILPFPGVRAETKFLPEIKGGQCADVRDTDGNLINFFIPINQGSASYVRHIQI